MYSFVSCFCSNLYLGDKFMLLPVAEVCPFLLWHIYYCNLAIHFTVDRFCVVPNFWLLWLRYLQHLCKCLLVAISNHFSCIYSQEQNCQILGQCLASVANSQTGLLSVRAYQQCVTVVYLHFLLSVRYWQLLHPYGSIMSGILWRFEFAFPR